MHPMLNIAIRAARNAGKIVAQSYENLEKVEVESKSANDFVTNVDRAAAKIITETIRKSYPDHSVIAEESGFNEGSDTDHQWIIDPIDSTNNFVKGIPHFAVSVALRIKGKTELGAVYDPLRNELFSASRGQGAQLNGFRIRASKAKDLEGTLLATGFPFKRKHYLESYLAMFGALFNECADMRRSGSPALDLAYVAAGRHDGFWELGLKPWEFAAGELIARESGALVTDFAGNPDVYQAGNIVCANPKVLKQLLSTVRPHLPEALKG